MRCAREGRIRSRSPPCLDVSQLKDLREARDKVALPLAVGFNRRHAPLAQRLRAQRRRTWRTHLRALPGQCRPARARPLAERPGRRRRPARRRGLPLRRLRLLAGRRCAGPHHVPRSAARGRPAGGRAGVLDHARLRGRFTRTVLYSASGAAGLGKEYVEAHAGGRRRRSKTSARWCWSTATSASACGRAAPTRATLSSCGDSGSSCTASGHPTGRIRSTRWRRRSPALRSAETGTGAGAAAVRAAGRWLC